jgi:hypothetical protein
LEAHVKFNIGVLVLALVGCNQEEEVSVPDGFAATVLAAQWTNGLDVSSADDSISFSGDGIPEHSVLEAYALFDSTTTTVTTYDLAVEIPTTPVYSETTTDTSGGNIGIAISGAVFFNPYEGDGSTVAVDNNFDVDGVPFLDSCNGHPLESGESYHYHGNPYCITDEVDEAGEHSTMIGLLLDGFPVYGLQGDDGSEPTDLDECSGHEGTTPEFPDGVYHYHFTESAPYSIACLHGEYTAGGDGPPDGGPPQR